MKTKKLLALLVAMAMSIGLLTVPVMAEGNVAKIDSTEYASLAEAIAAVPTDGTATTIRLIDDIDLGEFNETSALTITSGQNVVLDLAGHSIIGTTIKPNSSQMICNEGTLTINDSANSVMPDIDVTNSSDAIAQLDSYTGAKIVFYAGKPDGNYGYGQNAITNKGSLTINGGLIAAKQTEGGIVFPIDNYTNSADPNKVTTCTINGGEIYNWGMPAIRCVTFKTNGEIVKLNVNGGIIKGYKPVWIDYQSKAYIPEINITGGTIAYNNREKPTDAISTNSPTYGSGVKLSISGGSVDGVNLNIDPTSASEINITDGKIGYFTSTYGTGEDITGGTFNYCGWKFQEKFDSESDAQAFVQEKGYTQGQYVIAYYNVGATTYYYVYTYPSETWDLDDFEEYYVKDGYEAVDTDNGTFTVGRVVTNTLAPETTAAEGYDATYTATKAVVGSNNQTLATGATMTVNVKTVNSTVANTEISKFDMNEVISEAVKATDETTINVSIEIVRGDNNPAVVDNTITYEVHPVAKISVNNDEVKTVEIGNDALAENAEFNITLPVPDELVNNGKVKVTHKSEGFEDDVKICNVDGNAGAYTVTVTVRHFSDFLVSSLEAVEITGVDAFISSTNGLGNIRFLTTVNTTDIVTEYGTYFSLNGEGIENSNVKRNETAGLGAATSFDADLRDVAEFTAERNNFSTPIYAISYIVINGNHVWSDVKEATINQYNHN